MASGTNESIKDILNEFINIWARNENLYAKSGKAIDVDLNSYTFTFSPEDGSGDIPDVRMKVYENSNTSDYEIQVPAEGSNVVVVFESDLDAICISIESCQKLIVNCNDVGIFSNKYVFNSGTFGGLIKINELTAKLNAHISEYNKHINEYNLHVHPGGGTTNKPSQTANTFNASDYEDTKIKH